MSIISHVASPNHDGARIHLNGTHGYGELRTAGDNYT